MARCDWSPLAPALEVPLAAQPPPPLVGAQQGADGGNRIIKVLDTLFNTKTQMTECLLSTGKHLVFSLSTVLYYNVH